MNSYTCQDLNGIAVRALDETATPLVLRMRAGPRDLVLSPGIPRIETARRAGAAYPPHTEHMWVRCADADATTGPGHPHWCVCGMEAPDRCHGSGRQLRLYQRAARRGSVERFHPDRGRPPACSRAACRDAGVARVVGGEAGWLCAWHENRRIVEARRSTARV